MDVIREGEGSRWLTGQNVTRKGGGRLKEEMQTAHNIQHKIELMVTAPELPDCRLKKERIPLGVLRQLLQGLGSERLKPESSTLCAGGPGGGGGGGADVRGGAP